MDSSEPGSISVAIAGLAENEKESEAITLLWERYFERLGRFAKRHIFKRHQKFYDQEDIASSTFMALVDGFRKERFESVKNRDDLWQMLTVIAGRKIVNATKHFDRQKRGGGKVVGESVFGDSGIHAVAHVLEHPHSEKEFEYIESICDELLHNLKGEVYKKVAIMRLQGYSIKEIAEELGVCSRTVDRHLECIRREWNKQNEIDLDDE